MANPWDNDVTIDSIVAQVLEEDQPKAGPWERDIAVFRKTISEVAEGATLRPKARPEGLGEPQKPVARPIARPEMTDVVQEPVVQPLELSVPEVNSAEIAVPRPRVNPMTPESPSPVSIPKNINDDTEFLAAVENTASKFGLQASDILRVIKFETAGSFDPAQPSGTSSAVGLIQFMPDTAKGLGTTTKALASMTRAEQMKYVDKYLAPFAGRISNFDDLYMAIHWPRAVGKDSDYVMYSRGSNAYKANQGLDIDKDGNVTKREATFRARTVK